MNVLCVMAHPDDEVLGCGGTLAKHAENGDDIELFLFVARDLVFEHGPADKSAQTLGVKKTSTARRRDQHLDILRLGELVNDISYFIKQDPDVIYTHHPQDLNSDHALTARAVLTAFRPKPGNRSRTILACEVLSSTEWSFPNTFSPNYFTALSAEQLNKKVAALACYESECEPWPHPRSALGVRNLAAYRGQSVGVEAAEAFVLLRGGPH